MGVVCLRVGVDPRKKAHDVVGVAGGFQCPSEVIANIGGGVQTHELAYRHEAGRGGGLLAWGG